ncbi:anaerobic ribonucleoside-triphosphate reductase-activating protein [Paraferrimonas sp. SM1919]|uniref:anaerobic ribonucleoside-triphosphate reductase-activating protein n=1 Tax=Paraferrimonas sp. SM1919 TaxID=2662263 RepID=UPI0013D0BBA6|nr:anaerobic ribonucleoside-triphosphate reductase-activating protein [Paraferrimonas sp. SM1919]
MNYHKYHSLDVINGPGTRVSLFVAGCEHHCRGCFNQSTLSPTSGIPVTQALVEQIIIDLQDSRIPRRGLSLSGGDPLHPANLDGILDIVTQVKAACPDKDIWMWSGYSYEQLSDKQRRIVAMIDVLVDGKFEQELKDPSLKFRGSSNQRIINIQTL